MVVDCGSHGGACTGELAEPRAVPRCPPGRPVTIGRSGECPSFAGYQPNLPPASGLGVTLHWGSVTWERSLRVDAFDVIKVCFRRWWVLLPVILLALGSGLGLLQQQKPVYYGFGAFALVYTHGDALMPGGADPRNENPLSGNGAALLGEAMGADFSSATSQERYGGVGNKGTSPSQPDDDSFFHVGVPQGSSAYLVETWGPSPQGVRKVVDSVMAAAPKKASEIQDRAGAPPKSQYTTFITSPTQVVEMPPQSRLKLILAVSAVGLMAGAPCPSSSTGSSVVDRGGGQLSRRAGLRTASTCLTMQRQNPVRYGPWPAGPASPKWPIQGRPLRSVRRACRRSGTKGHQHGPRTSTTSRSPTVATRTWLSRHPCSTLSPVPVERTDRHASRPPPPSPACGGTSPHCGARVRRARRIALLLRPARASRCDHGDLGGAGTERHLPVSPRCRRPADHGAGAHVPGSPSLCLGGAPQVGRQPGSAHRHAGAGFVGGRRVLGLISARRGNPVRWLAFGWVLAALVAFTSGMLRVLTPD